MKKEFYNESWIKKVDYDTESKEMNIHMSNKIYTCVDVPEDVFSEFERAGSKGQFFNSNVKGQYQHEWFKMEEQK